MIWRHTASPNKPKKALQTFLAMKIMASVFWDDTGILFVELMERGTTITPKIYCEILRKLRRVI